MQSMVWIPIGSISFIYCLINEIPAGRYSYCVLFQSRLAPRLSNNQLVRKCKEPKENGRETNQKKRTVIYRISSCQDPTVPVKHSHENTRSPTEDILSPVGNTTPPTTRHSLWASLCSSRAISDTNLPPNSISVRPLRPFPLLLNFDTAEIIRLM